MLMRVGTVSPHTAILLSTEPWRIRFSFAKVVACFHDSAFFFGKRLHCQLCSFQVARPFLVNSSKRIVWSIRSSVGGGVDPSANSSGGTTRLIRTVQSLQIKLNVRFQELRKDLPVKFLFFLVGFYCATAFATVIGQTGDWDILSAALAVAVVEGIGALMYRASAPSLNRIRSLIIMFNYWKAGLTLGLFLDSFKY